VAKEYRSGPSPLDGWYRHRIEVARADGSGRRAAVDEYVPGDAICGNGMGVVGWSATGSLLYARPGCGDGCFRFAGWHDAFLLDPADGTVRAVGEGGRIAALSPDGRAVAFVREAVDSRRNRATERAQRSADGGGLEIVVEDLATGHQASLPLPPSPPGEPAAATIETDAPHWSTSARYVAVTELFGACPDETSSRVLVIDAESWRIIRSGSYRDPARIVDSWTDETHMKLAASGAPWAQPVVEAVDGP
jgi:hypothetical protein